jgi:HEAT repeat protein
MRLVFTLLFILLLIITVVLALAEPDHSLLNILWPLVILAVLGQVLLWFISVRRGRSKRTPRSQVAEIERLYFRAMREMLNEVPNYPQVINDLNRLLTFDPRYKNARHYLQRALDLQETGDEAMHLPQQTKAEFDRLQERLIDLDPAVRKSVVMDLIRYEEVAIDPLIALLMDDDADVRVHAATALGWVGGYDAVRPLLVALQDSDTQVRRYAARALCWVVNADAVESLIEVLDDEDNYVRCYAARALGWSQDLRAVEPLNDLLNDDSADVREYAATALVDLGEKVPAI